MLDRRVWVVRLWSPSRSQYAQMTRFCAIAITCRRAGQSMHRVPCSGLSTRRDHLCGTGRCRATCPGRRRTDTAAAGISAWLRIGLPDVNDASPSCNWAWWGLLAPVKVSDASGWQVAAILGRPAGL